MRHRSQYLTKGIYSDLQVKSNTSLLLSEWCYLAETITDFPPMLLSIRTELPHPLGTHNSRLFSTIIPYCKVKNTTANSQIPPHYQLNCKTLCLCSFFLIHRWWHWCWLSLSSELREPNIVRFRSPWASVLWKAEAVFFCIVKNPADMFLEVSNFVLSLPSFPVVNPQTEQIPGKIWQL